MLQPPVGLPEGIPSGKRLQNYGKSPCLMGNFTINGPFSIATGLVYQITRGYMSVLTCGCQFKVILSILRKCMYIAHPDTCLCEFLAYVYLLIDCSILTWKEEPQPTLFDMKPPIRNQSWTVCQHSN